MPGSPGDKGAAMADNASQHIPPWAAGTPFNFAQHLLDLNKDRGAKLAYTDDHGTLSYGELADRIRRMAAALLDAGLRRGDRVLPRMHACNDWPGRFLGATGAGIVPADVSPLRTA